MRNFLLAAGALALVAITGGGFTGKSSTTVCDSNGCRALETSHTQPTAAPEVKAESLNTAQSTALMAAMLTAYERSCGRLSPTYDKMLDYLANRMDPNLALWAIMAVKQDKDTGVTEWCAKHASFSN